MKIKKGQITIEVDSDTYCYLVRKYMWIDFHQLAIRNRKGVHIPLWRISRRCLNSLFKIQYLDGNKYNLQRTNLKLIRKIR